MTDALVAPERRAGVGDVLLDVRDLRTYFHVMDGTVKAVDGVSFSVRRGGRRPEAVRAPQCGGPGHE